MSRFRTGRTIPPPAPISARSLEKEKRKRSMESAAEAALYYVDEAFSCYHVLDLRRRMRVAVEAIFRHSHWKREGDPEGKDLHAITEALEKRGVRAEVIEWANHLRRFGNDAAHARDTEPLRLRVEDNEVEEALYTLRNLTHWYFETERREPLPPSITASVAFLDPKDVVAGRITDEQRLNHDARLFELHGKYRIEKLEGVGATAVVYAAFDSLLERRRALKVQKLELKQSEAILGTIRREAKLLSETQHPQLVGVSLIDRLPDGRLFFEMPYLEGGSVARRLLGQRLERRVALLWSIDLLEALVHLHEQGLVHRDVKPENLLIDARERVQLADLGLARTLEDGEFIRTRTVAGTVRYLAPEVQFGGRVGPCSDVYSAAIVICEMFGGSFEYGGVGDDIEEPLASLLRSMSAQDLRVRPSAVEALQRLRAWEGTLRRGSVRPPPGASHSDPPATVRESGDLNPIRFGQHPAIIAPPIGSLTDPEELWDRAPAAPEAVRARCDELLASSDDAEVREARARALIGLASAASDAERAALAEQAVVDATEALFFRPLARTYALRASARELGDGGEREQIWHDRETAFLMSFRDPTMLEELIAAEAAALRAPTYIGMSLVGIMVGRAPNLPSHTDPTVDALIESLRAYTSDDFARARSELDRSAAHGDPYTSLLRALVALGLVRGSRRASDTPPSRSEFGRIKKNLAVAAEGPAWLEEITAVVRAVVTALERGNELAVFPAPALLDPLQPDELRRLFRPTLDLTLAADAR